jgi:hypothetical protein
MDILKFNIKNQSAFFCFKCTSMVLITIASIIVLQHISFIIFLDVNVEYHYYLKLFFLSLILLLPFSFYVGWYSKRIRRFVCEKMIERYSDEIYLTNLTLDTSHKLVAFEDAAASEQYSIQKHILIEHDREKMIEALVNKIEILQHFITY